MSVPFHIPESFCVGRPVSLSNTQAYEYEKNLEEAVNKAVSMEANAQPYS